MKDSIGIHLVQMNGADRIAALTDKEIKGIAKDSKVRFYEGKTPLIIKESVLEEAREYAKKIVKNRLL